MSVISFGECLRSYCWVRGTYYLPYDEDIPVEEELKIDDSPNHKNIYYYQWVPAVMLVQALLFYTPYFIWSHVYPRICGIDIHSLVSAGYNFEATEMSEIRTNTLGFMTKQFDR